MRPLGASSDAALRRYAVKDMVFLALPFGVFWVLMRSAFLGAIFGVRSTR